MFVLGAANLRYLAATGGILMEYPFVIEIKKTPFLAWSAGLKIYKVVPLSSANRETFRNVYLVYLFFPLH